MPELTTDFYRQNEWANLTLIDACRPLTDEQLDATAPGTFGSIRDTFRHIVGAEAGYAFRLGNESIRRLRPDDPWPGFDVIVEMVKANADALAAAADAATDDMIRVGSETEPYDVEPAVILVQAFNHSTEHRSQISTILTTLGIEPPELSGWEWGLADGRMRPV
jgi:uncharacterized damage-inducible protein DinB